MNIDGFLKQTAVHWANPTYGGFGGRTFDDPAEIDVRWEDRQELFVDANGQEVRSSAVVYANTDLAVGEYLKLGELTDLESNDAPEANTGCYEIRGYAKTPSVDGTLFLRKAWL